MTQAPFQHGVASGDPLTDRMILWTRVTTDQPGPVDVTWQLALDADFQHLVATGDYPTTAEVDYTVHVDPIGLQPDTRYFYRFAALGQFSPIGQTRTLPEQLDHIRFAQVSCAKFNAGFFNAYARLAERDDLAFVLHLGDYIYEASNTPPASQTPGADIGRPFEPLHECKTLADYRMRYAQYRSDPDVQAVHAALPFIATLDDHELADGAWRDGAAEHKPERDGAWADRRAAALKAHWEWVPFRLPDPDHVERVYRSVQLGDLADLYLLDTRSMRDEPVPPPAMFTPTRSELGPAQRAWLFDGLEASVAHWRLIGNPSVLATTWSSALPDSIKKAMVKVKLIAADGLAPDWDQWDGYPVERTALLSHLRDRTRGNNVVLSGDVHVGLAIELKIDAFADEPPVAVEFVNTSLTSQNLDEKMGWAPRTKSLEVEQTLLQALPHIKWADLDSHGFNVVDVNRERVQVEWWFVDTVLQRTSHVERGAVYEVKSGCPELIRR